jgi:hypothetical protein
VLAFLNVKVVLRRLGVRQIIGAVAIVVSITLTGCGPDSRFFVCAVQPLVAVAADATPNGPTYLTQTTDTGSTYVGKPYSVDAGPPFHSIFRSTTDATFLALLAPRAGGVVVVNGGAAARRFDASGTLSWTVGYGTLVGVKAALTPDDHLFLADAASVRLFGPDGAAVWERTLPLASEASWLLSDRADGVWIVGRMSSVFPPWVPGPPSPDGDPVGHFILHFNGSGDVVGGDAWAGPHERGTTVTTAVVGAGPGGAPMLVVLGHTDEDDSDAPVFGLPRPHPFGAFVVSFDGVGQRLWSRIVDARVRLASDPDGNLIALASAENTELLLIDRWDGNGAEIMGTSFSVLATKPGRLDWTSAPAPGGVVVAGQHMVEQSVPGGCPKEHFVLRIDTAHLEVTPERLPWP